MNYRSVLGLLASILLMFFPGSSWASLTLRSNYEFDGNFSDLLGNESDMIPVGPGTFSNGSYSFSESNGLRLDSSLTSSDYAIEMDVVFTDLNDWDKLIDFEDRTSDNGLYVDPFSNKLRLYEYLDVSPSTIFLDTPYTIRLRREGGTVFVDLDGVNQFSVNDSLAFAVSSIDRLLFFIDDTVITGEGVAGSVSAIRLYADDTNSAIPEPNSVALVGLVVAVSSIFRRSRR